MIKKSISRRLALMFALASVFMVAAYGLMLRNSLHESLQKQMHNELYFRHSLIKPWIVSRTTLEAWQALAPKFSSLASAEGDRVQYWIVSDDPAFSVGGNPPPGVTWADLGDGYSSIAGSKPDSCLQFLLISTIPGSGERPALRYVVAIDSTPYMGTLEEFTQNLALISIGFIALVTVSGFIITRVGMRPVRSLSSQAHHLAPGQQGQRLDTSTLPNELQGLAIAFNGVLERQDIAWRQLESFNADVAHELRTPLTNIIGQTQLGLSRERSRHELEDLLESNLEELERMTSIVNDMLFLSHAQAGEYATELTEVSFYNEALKTIEYVEPSFGENRLEIKLEGDVTANIDRRLFHRALANLLENSARYAHPESTVTVSFKEESGQASIAVTNLGEPLEEQHLKRVFERFYRVDPSRVSGQRQHGLGLAIVRAVALMHHGDVFASSNGGLNTFGLTLAMNNGPKTH